MFKKTIRLTEADLHRIVKNTVNRIIKESSYDEDDTVQDYTHFAVNKKTGLIVNGWNYSDYDSDELRQFKNDYFFNDLVDWDFDPKEYKILTRRGCKRQGINPDDELNYWSNNGEISLADEKNNPIGESYSRLNEAFSSNKMSVLSKKHGGVVAADYTKNVLSDITDDMIDQVYPSKEEYQEQTGNDLDYLRSDKQVFWVPFKDGSIVTLKKPNDKEGAARYNKLFSNYGDVWGEKGMNRKANQKYSDFHTQNYIPQGHRGDDYYSMMKNAKEYEGGKRLSKYDKDPVSSVYRYGSNLDRYKNNMEFDKAKRQGKLGELEKNRMSDDERERKANEINRMRLSAKNK